MVCLNCLIEQAIFIWKEVILEYGGGCEKEDKTDFYNTGNNSTDSVSYTHLDVYKRQDCTQYI